MSFDDFPWSSFIGISSVQQDSVKIGSEAFKILLNAINTDNASGKKGSECEKIVPGRFHIRQSSINKKRLEP